MKLRSVEGLRGLAAILVVVAHATEAIGQQAGLHAPGAAPQFRFPGVPSVEFFFVLSGFVMMLAHAPDFGQAARVPAFLWRRACRIYPVFWLVTAIMLWQFRAAPNIHVGTVLDWFSLLPISTQDLLPVAWTLRYEMTFYLMLALVMLPRVGPVVLAAWVAALAANAMGWLQGHDHIVLLQYVLHPFNALFLAGLLAGWLFRRATQEGTAKNGSPWALSGAATLAVMGALGVAWCLSASQWGAVYGSLGNLVATGMGFGAVLLGVAWLDRHVGLPRWLGHLAGVAGAISYPLYVGHLLVMDQMAAWLGASGVAVRIGPGATLLALVLACVLAALLLAYGVDRPAQRLLRRGFWHGQPQPAG